MRVFSLLFSLYILVLSVVPCCVFCGNRENNEAIAVAGKSHEEQQGDEDGCKNCSPFTLCGHCVGFTVTARFARVERVVLGRRVDWRETTPSYCFAYSASCWQPPRMG